MTGSSEARVPHDPAVRAAIIAKFEALTRALALELPGPVYADYALRVWALLDRMERLAPLEAAVLDAAKAWLDGGDPEQDDLVAAVRALQEATDAAT